MPDVLALAWDQSNRFPCGSCRGLGAGPKPTGTRWNCLVCSNMIGGIALRIRWCRSFGKRRRVAESGRSYQHQKAGSVYSCSPELLGIPHHDLIRFLFSSADICPWLYDHRFYFILDLSGDACRQRMHLRSSFAWRLHLILGQSGRSLGPDGLVARETLSFPLLPLPLVLLLIVDSGSFVVPLLHPGPRPRTLCRWTSVV